MKNPKSEQKWLIEILTTMLTTIIANTKKFVAKCSCPAWWTLAIANSIRSNNSTAILTICSRAAFFSLTIFSFIAWWTIALANAIIFEWRTSILTTKETAVIVFATICSDIARSANATANILSTRVPEGQTASGIWHVSPL